MKKQLLVIGGSYFVGRVFCILASRTGAYDITVVNRGRYELKLDGVTQIHMDRHNTAALAQLPDKEYDAILDFCAYEPGDIRGFVEAMPCTAKQYVYISTASVYDTAAPRPINESAPVTQAHGADENSIYVRKKLMLEDECRFVCKEKGIAYTIFRPTFIYGPFNYAPRESWYFTHLLEHKPIPNPQDATALFQVVYVKDVAEILMRTVGNEKTYNEVFNLSAPEDLDNPRFLAVLERTHGQPLLLVNTTVSEALDQGVALPFPLLFDEVYDGSKAARTLEFRYTPFAKGFKETYDIYMKAFNG